jgi:glutamate synthase (NADPH/NADH) small chain
MSKPDRQKPAEQCEMVRRGNFESVEANLTGEQAQLEASRCLGCKNAPCSKGCPVEVDIPAFIQAVSRGDIVIKNGAHFLNTVIFIRYFY